MLTIRLQRTGKRNAASFRIVVAEKASHVSKKITEALGTYNPAKKQFSIANPERLSYWLGQHVEASPTVHNLLVSKGLLKADKVKAFSTPKKPAEKVAEPVAAAVAPVEKQPTEEIPAVAEPATETALEEAPAEPQA